MKELVPGEADYKANLDTSYKGARGVRTLGTKDLAPIVWRIKWPDKVRRRFVTFTNTTGDIKNSDLRMAAEVMGWMVLEGLLPIRWIHAGVCSNNSATVS